VLEALYSYLVELHPFQMVVDLPSYHLVLDSYLVELHPFQMVEALYSYLVELHPFQMVVDLPSCPLVLEALYSYLVELHHLVGLLYQVSWLDFEEWNCKHCLPLEEVLEREHHLVLLLVLDKMEAVHTVVLGEVVLEDNCSAIGCDMGVPFFQPTPLTGRSDCSNQKPLSVFSI
jgi:hypothetical protein